MKLSERHKIKDLTYPFIQNLINEGDHEALASALRSLTPFELSELIANKPEKVKGIIFNALPEPLALQTFEFLPSRIQRKFLNGMPSDRAVTFLESVAPDDRTHLLQNLPRKVSDRLVSLLPQEERLRALTLLGYPKGSVGRLMTPDYIAVGLDWTVEKVLDHIRSYGHDSETIDVIYVLDGEGKLLDDIKLKDFLFVPRQAKVEDISDKQFVALSVHDSDEIAIQAFRKHDRDALPVLDEKGTLLGIVTIDDVLRLANREATADIQKIGGTEALEEPYMQAPFLQLMNKRARWLIILFIGEMCTATAMGYFEQEISQAVVLALFLPLIISSGGNAGSQASTLVIRAMALGEVKLKDWWTILKRELFSGVFLGSFLGFMGFFRVTIWSLFSDIYGAHWLMIAFTVAFSLIGVVMWGTLSGAILPLVLRRMGADPATSSAPFVATIVDVTGIVIYFVFAMYFLKGTVL